MAFFINQPDPGAIIGQGLGQGISTMFDKITQGLEKRREQNLTEDLVNKLDEIKDPQEGFNTILKSKLSNENKQNLLNSYSTFQKNIQEKNQKKQEDTKIREMGSNIKNSLIDAGYTPQTAKLWADQFESAPTGGKTDVIKNVNDLLKRSPKGKQKTEGEIKPTLEEIEVPGKENIIYDLDFPEIPEPDNLTPTELAKRKGNFEAFNLGEYNKNIKELEAYEDEYRDLQNLQALEETGKLPSIVGRLNVDWETGDLRVPALSQNAEAEAYVKTIARLLRRAKEFYPGRVTNFDLQQFRTNFPNLANSQAGRILINRQLQLANRISFLKDEILKTAYDHYGTDANPQLVKKYARQNYAKLKKDLEKELIDTNKQADKLANETLRKINEVEKSVDVKKEKGSIVYKFQTPEGRIFEISQDDQEAIKEIMGMGAKRI